MNNIINLFPTKIYKVKLDIDHKKLSEFIENLWNVHYQDVIDNNYKSMRDGSLCIYNIVKNLHSYKETLEFRQAIDYHIRVYWKELGYDLRNLDNIKLFQMWSNIYKQDSFIDIHNHSPAILTSNYYVKKRKDSSNIRFLDPNEMILKYQPLNINFDNYADLCEEEINVSEGDLLIFPGYLKHRTLPNTSVEDRVTITSNFLINKS